MYVYNKWTENIVPLYIFISILVSNYEQTV